MQSEPQPPRREKLRQLTSKFSLCDWDCIKCESMLTASPPVSYTFCAVNIDGQCVVWPEIFFADRAQQKR